VADTEVAHRVGKADGGSKQPAEQHGGSASNADGDFVF